MQRYSFLRLERKTTDLFTGSMISIATSISAGGLHVCMYTYTGTENGLADCVHNIMMTGDGST
jgi:hypothetical protein